MLFCEHIDMFRFPDGVLLVIPWEKKAKL